MGIGDLCWMPLAAVRNKGASKSSGTGPCGDCRRILWGTGPAGSVFGENSFYRETWGTRRGGRHVAKRSSDPRVVYPEVKVQVRDLVRVVGIVVPFAQGRSVPWKNSFYRVPGSKRAKETFAGCPQQRCTTEEAGKVQGRDRVGIVKGSCGYRTRGVSIRGKFVLSRNPGYGGSPLSLAVKYLTMVARHCH